MQHLAYDCHAYAACACVREPLLNPSRLSEGRKPCGRAGSGPHHADPDYAALVILVRAYWGAMCGSRMSTLVGRNSSVARLT